MKLAIDSYCYHRYFGEIYPGLQKRPRRRMTVWDFLDRAEELGVEGVSLESCFLEPVTDRLLEQLRDRLDQKALERVWAWGHPLGLKSGTDRAALDDLCRHIEIAARLGAPVMRIVGGNRQTRPASWSQHRRRLLKALERAVRVAEKYQVTLALENHIDLLADELVELMETFESPWLGVCLDTGNNIRLFEEPLGVVEKLAPWTRATHIKDIFVWKGDPKEFSFWPSVPLGEGLVPIPEVIRILQRHRYRGLLAIEVDFLHPSYEDEDKAVEWSVGYLNAVLQGDGARKAPQRRTDRAPATQPVY
jgi:sugar phosphate isomerase/epimerase